MKTFLCFLVWSFLCSAHARIFDVKEFGARGDGVTFDTAAIQKAFDACGEAGGTVRFPPGVYLSRPLTLHSSITVDLEPAATLLASTNQNDFMKTPGDWRKAGRDDFIPFIHGSGLRDVRFTGGGTIDGSGSAWWPEAELARERVPGYTLPRPNLVALERCRNVWMENIRLQNSPKYHFVPVECEDIVVSNVTIFSPAHSANTDGIDPGESRNILITRCHIDNGDDNVAIKSGRREPGRTFASENILVTDCVFLHGHGMSIGSETSGGVGNVTVSNCVFCGTENGLRIKSQRGKGGLVENIVYEDIRMTNVDPAITFSCYYTGNSSKDPVQNPIARENADEAARAATPVYRNITVRHLTATCERGAGIIYGLPDSLVANVLFDDVTISALSGMKIENATGIRLKNVHLTVHTGAPFILKNAQIRTLKEGDNSEAGESVKGRPMG